MIKTVLCASCSITALAISSVVLRGWYNPRPPKPPPPIQSMFNPCFYYFVGMDAPASAQDRKNWMLSAPWGASYVLLVDRYNVRLRDNDLIPGAVHTFCFDGFKYRLERVEK